MSTNESNKQSRPFYWFKFYPHEWIELLTMQDNEVGKRFKIMIERLITNKAPNDSPENKMIEECCIYSERQRERVSNYWKQRNGDADSREAPDESTTVSAAPSMTRRPTRPPIPSPTKPKKPSLEDVYEYCDSIGTPPPIGREWYEWQESKGWNNFTSTWQAAFRAFAAKRRKK